MGKESRAADLPGSVAIIGTGWLGAPLACELARRGSRVVAASRSGTLRGMDQIPTGIEPIRFDLLGDGDDALARILSTVDAALFCFASGGNQDRRRLYVEGAAVIGRACSDVSLDRVVYTSSTSALAARDGWVEEEDPAWPDSERGRIQRDAEECLGGSWSRKGIPWVILRLAGLYGPQRELERLYRVGDRDLIRSGDGLERTNLIHLEDAMAAVLAALTLPPSVSGLIHICDDDHRTRREVAADVARGAGLPDPRWERSPTATEPRGKMVCNRRMKTVLGLNLLHPEHRA